MPSLPLQLPGVRKGLFPVNEASCEAGLRGSAPAEQDVELLLADARAEMARLFDRLQMQTELARQ